VIRVIHINEKNSGAEKREPCAGKGNMNMRVLQRSQPARNNRQAETARSATTPMVSVYDGRACLGFIFARGRAGYEALNREQRSLGLFKTAAVAANVVFAAASDRP
jgi:hypothetical protein